MRKRESPLALGAKPSGRQTGRDVKVLLIQTTNDWKICYDSCDILKRWAASLARLKDSWFWTTTGWAFLWV